MIIALPEGRLALGGGDAVVTVHAGDTVPELPDIDNYVAAIHACTGGTRLVSAAVTSPFLLRTAEPPLASAIGQHVAGVERIGKRIAIGLDGGLWLVFHLMIAGRLHWHERPAGPSRRTLAQFGFERGVLSLTEAGSKRRASLHVVAGRPALDALDPGGLEVLTASPAEVAARLTRSNHTLKRALTDPRILSGIGNAYSDEILHRARLSPVRLTNSLSAAELAGLCDATVAILAEWKRRLAPPDGAFPAHVTAFREGMAVHGRYGLPCPDCGTLVQRIRYASNETNYCPRCQTGGRLLADRSLSRLLKKDWPRTVEELEARSVDSR
jgi:formamidopyrimidine-DNA glycosylase